MKSPYPYFGGKSTIMPEVWKRLGDTPNFVDPFLGSNAPLLSRAGWDWSAGQWRDGKNRIETVNDKDCFVANFWRSLDADPAGLAKITDWPVNEADLHARHLWLVRNEDFITQMKTDPDFFDIKVAGWWVWGLCQWIGGCWCAGPQKKQLPHLGDAGRGVHRPSKPRPNLNGAGMGVHRPSKKRPNLNGAGMGVHRPSKKRPNLGNAGRGVHRSGVTDIYEYFELLAARLRRVRVCCGDWTRVLGPTPTEGNGLTSVILDPPYGEKAGRDKRLYAVDSLSVADEVRKWAIANGDNPKLRIALFGYEDEHAATMPASWECLAWKTHGGYSNQSNGNDNPAKERVWFSPACLRVAERPEQMSLAI